MNPQKITTIVLRVPVVAIAAVTGLSLAQACGGASASSRCQIICDCIGCTATERAACEASHADAEKLASDKGCSDPYDAYLSCFDTHAQCVAEKMDVVACTTEAAALASCSGSAVKPPAQSSTPNCDAYIAAAKACCDKVPDASSKATCNAQIDSIATTLYDAAKASKTDCPADAKVTCPY